MPTMTRRQLVLAAASLAALPPLARAEGAPALHVLKDPNCGCCAAWVEILRAEGFAVTVEEAPAEALARRKAALGVPLPLASCHTGQVAGYFVEGHVPPAEIRRLLRERPLARGLAVPGMPWGSPGMGPESEREAYDVVLVRRDGGHEVFARHDAA